MKKKLLILINFFFKLFGYLKSVSFFDIEKNLNKFGYKLIVLNYSSNVISLSNYQVDTIYVKHNILKKLKIFTIKMSILKMLQKKQITNILFHNNYS